MLGDKLLQIIVPAVLIIVCFNQLYLAFTKDLTPWKGGGFGMFATIDRMEYRPIHINVNTNEGSCIVNPQDVIGNQMEFRGVQALPTPHKLERIAKSIFEREWVIDTGNSSELHCLLKQNEGDLEASAQSFKEIDEVEITVYRFNFDTRSDSLSLRILREHTFIQN